MGYPAPGRPTGRRPRRRGVARARLIYAGPMSTDCLFCRLLAGQGEVSVVVAEELVVAFMDAVPVAEEHVLVVPRRHVRSIAELSTAEGSALWALAQRLSARIRAEFAPALNLHLADGTEADQDVPHVHLHLLPRHGDDRIVIDLPGARATREDLDRAARRLAAG